MVDAIRKLCKERKVTVKKMETDLGFPDGTVQRWDRNRPSVDRACAVASYLGTTVEAILGGEE